METQIKTNGTEYGTFRARFMFDGLTGEVDEIVTFERSEDSRFYSVEEQARAVAEQTVEETYNGDASTTRIISVQHLDDY